MILSNNCCRTQLHLHRGRQTYNNACQTDIWDRTPCASISLLTSSAWRPRKKHFEWLCVFVYLLLFVVINIRAHRLSVRPPSCIVSGSMHLFINMNPNIHTQIWSFTSLSLFSSMYSSERMQIYVGTLFAVFIYYLLIARQRHRKRLFPWIWRELTEMFDMRFEINEIN